MTIPSQDIADFETALKEYKKRHGRMFPTCSEILEVARDIGYSKPEWELPAETAQYEDEDFEEDFCDLDSDDIY